MGVSIAYNRVQVEISQIAIEAEVPPLCISSTMVLHYIQYELLWCAIAMPRTIPSKLKAMRVKVKSFVLPKKENGPNKGALGYLKQVIPFSENMIN